MKIQLGILFALLAISGLSAVNAQDVLVSRANKTIQITASSSLQVAPELARLHFGYKNYGATQQSAIDQNVQDANKITKALLDAGVPKEAIETETVRIDRARDTEYGTGKGNDQEFIAIQEWTVTAPVSTAEQVLQTAIRAGANMVREVEWIVKDPEALSSKANASALDKTKAMALQMANQMNAKLGELLFVSNSEPEQFSRFDRRGGGGMGFEYASAPPPPPPLPLHLFPAKVERNATVTAVFALE